MRLSDIGSSGDLYKEWHKYIKEPVLYPKHPMYDPKDSNTVCAAGY